MDDVKVTREDREAAAAALREPVLGPQAERRWAETGEDSFGDCRGIALEYRDVAHAIANARAEGAAEELAACVKYMNAAPTNMHIRMVTKRIEQGEHRGGDGGANGVASPKRTAEPFGKKP